MASKFENIQRVAAERGCSVEAVFGGQDETVETTMTIAGEFVGRLNLHRKLAGRQRRNNDGLYIRCEKIYEVIFEESSRRIRMDINSSIKMALLGL
jgi:hypothetical protein